MSKFKVNDVVACPKGSIIVLGDDGYWYGIRAGEELIAGYRFCLGSVLAAEGVFLCNLDDTYDLAYPKEL